MAEGKKITDIVPPEKAEDTTKDAAAPTISKHGGSATFAVKDDNNPTETVSTNPETQGAEETKEEPKSPSKAGVDIKPVTENLQEAAEQEEKAAKEAEAPKEEVSDFVSKPEEESSSDGDTADKKEENEEDQVGGPKEKAPYEASDSLPDENDKKTAEATDNMQSPKIYDTKEYFVPIKRTAHSHGGTGIILAGIISAALVAVAVYLASIYLF